MHLSPRLVALAALLFAALWGAAPGVAGDLTPEERERIEEALRSQGYTEWDHIEADEQHWEVDNAKASDGKVYDLMLDRETMRVIDCRKDADD